MWPLEAEVSRCEGRGENGAGHQQIVLRRHRLQAAKLKLSIAGADQMRLLVGDGLLIATPLGSTGYNRSLGGARLLLDLPLIAMTGLALHPASEWSNAVVADHLPIQVDVIDPTYRPGVPETIAEEVHDAVGSDLWASFIPVLLR